MKYPRRFIMTVLRDIGIKFLNCVDAVKEILLVLLQPEFQEYSQGLAGH